MRGVVVSAHDRVEVGERQRAAICMQTGVVTVSPLDQRCPSASPQKFASIESVTARGWRVSVSAA